MRGNHASDPVLHPFTLTICNAFRAYAMVKTVSTKIPMLNKIRMFEKVGAQSPILYIRKAEPYTRALVKIDCSARNLVFPSPMKSVSSNKLNANKI